MLGIISRRRKAKHDMLQTLFRTFGIVKAAGLVASAFIRVVVIFPLVGPAVRLRQISAWSAKVLALFGLRLVTTGLPNHQNPLPRLIAANHVSWLDIIVIWATTDTVFVAKTEVGHWPVIGGLARRLGVIFIDRSKRSDALAAGKAVGVALSAGRSVCIFPEGTSTEGRKLQPFHSALFQAAIITGAPVQPIAIRYFRTSGSRATEAAFTGDMSLVQSMWRLSSADPIDIDLGFLTPISSHGHDRRTLARQAHEVIAWRLRDPMPRPLSISMEGRVVDADALVDDIRADSPLMIR
jgi:1-acyl-sn-glycerol-3-phosphate acyltransferase